VKLTVHAEVLGGAILQQVFVVEYTVSHQMCEDCHRSEAQDYWRAVVSIMNSENLSICTTFYP
jgi:nonsense-mediated mRNA decay protein 3